MIYVAKDQVLFPNGIMKWCNGNRSGWCIYLRSSEFGLMYSWQNSLRTDTKGLFGNRNVLFLQTAVTVVISPEIRRAPSVLSLLVLLMKHSRVADAVGLSATELGQQIDRKSDGEHLSGDKLAINFC